MSPLSQTKIKVNGGEDVWVELTLENNDTLIVGSVYRHPISTISDLRTFEDAFVSIIKSFKTNQKYLVLGDLNIHIFTMIKWIHLNTLLIILITLIVLAACNLLPNRQEYVQPAVPSSITSTLTPHLLAM